MYTQAVVIPLLSIVAIIIVITPLVLHTKNKNYPAASILCWFILLDLFNIINAFIWGNDDIESWWDGQGLCDVEAKFMIASYIGVPGGLVCVFRNLARVLDTRGAMLVPDKKRRFINRGMEVLFCIVAPLAAMASHIAYQRSRYMIFGITGCINDFDRSAMSFGLSFIWPPIICFIACYYCTIVLYRLQKYRSQFNDILNSSSTNMNRSRFFRLFFLNFTVLIIILPVQCFVLYWNVRLSWPWHTYSWAKVHGPWFNEIIKRPSGGNAFFDRWIPITASLLVFLFYGCGKDANDLYKMYLRLLGFDRCFPSLRPGYKRQMSTGTASTGSRVKLLFHRRWSSTSRTFFSATTTANTATNTTAVTQNHDPEKGLPRTTHHHQNLQHQNQQLTPPLRSPSSWVVRAWSLLRRSVRPVSERSDLNHNYCPGLAIPETTVHTNAWAGMSASRPSQDGRGEGDGNNNGNGSGNSGERASGSGGSPSGCGTPQTPTRKDFIRIRQEISQESEMQEVV